MRPRDVRAGGGGHAVDEAGGLMAGERGGHAGRAGRGELVVGRGDREFAHRRGSVAVGGRGVLDPTGSGGEGVLETRGQRRKVDPAHGEA